MAVSIDELKQKLAEIDGMDLSDAEKELEKIQLKTLIEQHPDYVAEESVVEAPVEIAPEAPSEVVDPAPEVPAEPAVEEPVAVEPEAPLAEEPAPTEEVVENPNPAPVEEAPQPEPIVEEPAPVEEAPVADTPAKAQWPLDEEILAAVSIGGDVEKAMDEKVVAVYVAKKQGL